MTATVVAAEQSHSLRPVLIIAVSARQIAQAAAAAGWAPWTLDFFADEDTRSVAAWSGCLGPRAGWQFDADELRESIGRRAQEAGAALPLVIGAGFERQPALLERLPSGLEPCASNADVFRRLAAFPLGGLPDLNLRGAFVPQSFADTQVTASGRWVYKAHASTGGAHVRSTPPVADGCHYYRQQYVDGRTCSALVLASGPVVRLCGISHHLRSTDDSNPFRYVGALTEPGISAQLVARLEGIAAVLARQFGIRGAFGFDFIVSRAGHIAVVDINPRFTATLELYPDAARIFSAHMDCCTGHRLLYSRPRARRPRGHFIVFCKGEWQVPAGFEWPASAADRPPQGTRVGAGDPLVTLRGEGENAAEVCRALTEAYAGLARRIARHHAGVIPPAVTIRTNEEAPCRI